MKFILFSILVTFLFVDSVYGLNRERDCQCKVNNGTNGENLYPWLVNVRSLLLPNNLTICHATILNENTLLTSATCVPSSPETKDLLKFIKIEVKGYKNLIDIEKVISHPDYKPENYSAKHDIALIKVNASFKFDSFDGQNNIAPGCLGDYFSAYIFLKSTLTYASLGSLNPVYINKTTGDIKGFRPSSNLVEGQGSDDSQEKCGSKVDDVVCVTAHQTPSICLGGQGTPIHFEKTKGIVRRKTKSIIVGVSSIPKPVHLENGMIEMCTNEIEAARVNRYISWIMDELNDNLCYFNL